MTDDLLPGVNYVWVFSMGAIVGIVEPRVGMVFVILWMVWVAAYHYEREKRND